MYELFLVLTIFLIIVLFSNKRYDTEKFLDSEQISISKNYNNAKLPLRLEMEETSWLDGKTIWEYHPDPLIFKATAVSPDLPDDEKTLDTENECSVVLGQYKERVMKYFELYQENYQAKPVVYQKAVYKWGRVKCTDWLSMAVMKRNIRSTIWSDYYTDFDMENAHPVILSQILKGHYKCPILDYYVNNRDVMLADFMKRHNLDRKIAKEYIFAVLFGRTYYPVKDNMLTNFINERKGNDKIKGWANVLKEANPHIYNTAMHYNITEKNEETPSKHLKTMITWILQEYEYRLFCAVFEWCEKEGLLTAPDVPQLSGKLVFSYIYDGGCILTSAIKAWMNRTGKTMQYLLKQFSDIGFIKTGIRVYWIAKDWDDKIDITKCYAELKCYDFQTLM